MNHKDAYLQNLDARLNVWSDEIEKLRAKVRTSNIGKQIEYQKQIEALQARREEIGEMIEVLRRDGMGGWEDLRTSIENARNALDKAVESVKSTLH
jgi:prefoldin subunit 5